MPYIAAKPVNDVMECVSPAWAGQDMTITPLSSVSHLHFVSACLKYLEGIQTNCFASDYKHISKIVMFCEEMKYRH